MNSYLYHYDYYYLNEIKFTNAFLGLFIQLTFQGGPLEGITPREDHDDDEQHDDPAHHPPPPPVSIQLGLSSSLVFPAIF